MFDLQRPVRFPPKVQSHHQSTYINNLEAGQIGKSKLETLLIKKERKDFAAVILLP